MRFVLRACVGTLAIIVVPGLLVVSIIGLRMRELLTWAAIPAYSIASVFVLGEATNILRLPFGLPAFALLLFVLGSALVLVRSRRSALLSLPGGTQRDGRAPAPIETRRGERVAFVLLAIGVVVGVSTWLRGLRSVPLIPPGGDATRHGWFVARILYEHTIDLPQVLAYDVGGAHHTVQYYPLALHASAALSTRLVGSDVGRVLVAYIVVFSAVVLPIGMFVLARILAPTRPLVAGFTALVVPLMMLFPYSPVWAGDVPQMVAMAIVPAAIVLLWQAMLARHPRIQLNRALVMALAPSALAIFCIISLHTSELPLVVFLALLLVLERAWRTHDAWMLGPALLRGVAVGVLATGSSHQPSSPSPTVSPNERRQPEFVVENPANWESRIGPILQLRWGPGTVRQGFLALLALAGAALSLMWRRPAWVAGWVGVVLLTLFASASTNRLAHLLTFPWYHLSDRIVLNVALFVPFFAGVTLAYGVVLITRVLRRSWAIFPATLAMIVVLTQFVGVHSFRADSKYIRASFNPSSSSFFNQALVADSSLTAFQWLHNHAARGDTVANDPLIDGSLWMYAQQHVSPLIGPLAIHTTISQELADRLYFIHHLQSLGSDTRTDDLARHYHTRWVFFDTHRLVLGTRAMNLDVLATQPEPDSGVPRGRHVGVPSRPLRTTKHR